MNVQGWIFDDNTGILDSAGTCDTAHYRLAYDSVWGLVEVGSRIVLFNHIANCYNLPDTFTYDDSNHIYWIPIGGTAGSPYGTPHVERYYTTANTSCGYCSDTGITVYDTASDWAHTMLLSSLQDGIQVRCPGCTAARPASPQFYDGVEYIIGAGTSEDSLVDSSSNVGLVLIAPSGSHHKYVFTGSTYEDLLDTARWHVDAADTAGTPPPTAGYVDSAFYLAAFQHTLGLPCCGTGLRGMYQNAPAKRTAIDNLKVYPNPANSILYFEIPLPIAIGSESNIRIMDITGRVVAQQPVHGELRTGVDVKGFTPGMYIYQVSTG